MNRASSRRLLQLGKVLAAVCFGAAAGLCVGRYLRTHTNIATATPSLQAKRSALVAASKTNEQRSAMRVGSAAAKLEQDLSMCADVTRWLYWFEALEKAQPADLPRLA